MFSIEQKVKFKHCDPAGIVFYPRYFEMINDTVEQYFESSLDYPFSEVILNNGVPTAQIDATFSAPSRLGDMLSLQLCVMDIGKSSLKLRFTAYCEGELRFSAHSVIVYVDENGKSTSWPDSIRQAIDGQILGEKK